MGAFFGEGCADAKSFNPLASDAECKLLNANFLAGKWSATTPLARTPLRQYTLASTSKGNWDQFVLTDVTKPSSQNKGSSSSKLKSKVTLQCATKSDGLLCEAQYVYKRNS